MLVTIDYDLFRCLYGGHNALAYAARNERTITVNAIARLLNDVESLQDFDGMLDIIDEHEDSKNRS